MGRFNLASAPTIDVLLASASMVTNDSASVSSDFMALYKCCYYYYYYYYSTEYSTEWMQDFSNQTLLTFVLPGAKSRKQRKQVRFTTKVNTVRCASINVTFFMRSSNTAERMLSRMQATGVTGGKPRSVWLSKRRRCRASPSLQNKSSRCTFSFTSLFHWINIKLFYTLGCIAPKS